MKELETVLSEIVKKAIEVAEKTGEFAIEQAPLLLVEFYRWNLIKNIFVALVIALGIFILWKIFKSCGSVEEKDSKILNKYYDDYFLIVFGTPSVILVIIGILFFVKSLYNIIFILTAPKLYLIEYFIK